MRGAVIRATSLPSWSGCSPRCLAIATRIESQSEATELVAHVRLMMGADASDDFCLGDICAEIAASVCYAGPQTARKMECLRLLHENLGVPITVLALERARDVCVFEYFLDSATPAVLRSFEEDGARFIWSCTDPSTASTVSTVSTVSNASSATNGSRASRGERLLAAVSRGVGLRHVVHPDVEPNLHQLCNSETANKILKIAAWPCRRLAARETTCHARRTPPIELQIRPLFEHEVKKKR